MNKTRKSIPAGTPFTLYGYAVDPQGALRGVASDYLKGEHGAKRQGMDRWLDVTFTSTKAADAWSYKATRDACEPLAVEVAS